MMQTSCLLSFCSQLSTHRGRPLQQQPSREPRGISSGPLPSTSVTGGLLPLRPQCIFVQRRVCVPRLLSSSYGL